LKHTKDLRGLNQALGLGTLDNWVPILQGTDMFRRKQDDEEDEEDEDDEEDEEGTDSCNEYATIWLNLAPASVSPFRVMISVADDHGRCGFVGLRLTLSELLEQMAHCGPVRYMFRKGWPIHFG
jgi:hypothetical protein